MEIYKECENRKKAWEAFIYNNDVSLCKNSIIADSWQRCCRMNVDYESGKGKSNDEGYINKILKINENLINVAKPIMNDIYNLIKDTHFVLVLTAANCDIIVNFLK